MFFFYISFMIYYSKCSLKQLCSFVLIFSSFMSRAYPAESCFFFPAIISFRQNTNCSVNDNTICFPFCYHSFIHFGLTLLIAFNTTMMKRDNCWNIWIIIPWTTLSTRCCRNELRHVLDSSLRLAHKRKLLSFLAGPKFTGPNKSIERMSVKNATVGIWITEPSEWWTFIIPVFGSSIIQMHGSFPGIWIPD